MDGPVNQYRMKDAMKCCGGYKRKAKFCKDCPKLAGQDGRKRRKTKKKRLQDK
jgi:hypothetical protein